MNELQTLFPVSSDSLNTPTIDGRKLHEWLGVGRDFTNWIKERIEKYGFLPSQDFSPTLAETSATGGRPKTEYLLTVSMAKELAMVENNDKGREVRKYFLECEKALFSPIKKPTPISTVMTPQERIDATEWVRQFAESSNDAVLQVMVGDLVKNTIIPMIAGQTPLALPAPAVFQTFEILEGFGLPAKAVRAESSYCGRLLATAYRTETGEEPPKTPRIIDGANRLVMAYPEEWRERATSILNSHLSAKSLIAS